MGFPCKGILILPLLTLSSHKDHLVYGGSFLFWGVIAYVEVAAYYQHII